MNKKPQLKLFKDSPKAYGGELFKTRKGRLIGGRPLDTKNTMHLVLRSSLAKGPWSFTYRNNGSRVRGIVEKFAIKYGVKIISLANVGNHLHMQIKLSNRYAYKMFIRAITSAIAMAITNTNRWSKHRGTVGVANKRASKKVASQAEVLSEIQIEALYRDKLSFWDLRPFTRIILGWKAILGIKDYIRINEMEGWGFKRSEARNMLDVEKWIKSTA